LLVGAKFERVVEAGLREIRYGSGE
jgi:hypothetical protein